VVKLFSIAQYASMLLVKKIGNINMVDNYFLWCEYYDILLYYLCVCAWMWVTALW